MSLWDFIGEETEITYREPKPSPKGELYEVFSDYKPYKGNKYVYSKFHRRLKLHFPDNELLFLRDIRLMMQETYGYHPSVIAKCMWWLWKTYKARRFVHHEWGNRGFGIHYVLLPKNLWGEKNKHLWEEVPGIRKSPPVKRDGKTHKHVK